MSIGKIKNLIQETLVKAVDPLLNRQTEEGYFKQENPEAPFGFDSQAIYPLSYLYKTKFPGNTHYKQPRILESIKKLGDYCATKTNADGLMYYYSYGNTGYALEQRLLIFWLDAFVLIKDEFDQKTQKKWVAAMKRSLVHLEKTILGFDSQGAFNSYSFGTSPNHASLYACALFIGGTVFKNKKWQTLAIQFMDKFVAFQTNEGYWPEGHGPVGVYCTVSLAGVARMSQMLKGRYKDAILNAQRYFSKISYPDTSFVELIDKRNHYNANGYTWGFHGFFETPEARSFALHAIEANIKRTQKFTGELCARLLENLAHMKDGPVANFKHWSGTQFLGNHSAFIRKNSWQINYSVNPVVVHPHSPFRLDYGKVYSVWHKSIGLIVDGSQSKKNNQHNTFFTKDTDSLGILYGARLHTNAKEPSIEALYASGDRLAVKTTFKGTNEILISGELVSAGKNAKNIRFNVPLYLRLHDEIYVNNKKIILSPKKLSTKLKKGSTIKSHSGKVLITLHCDGVIYFPEFLFNPYSSDNSSPIESAFLRLELCPNQTSKTAQVSLKIK